MATVIKSPNSIQHVRGMSVFLAGTIDEGKSVDWQETLAAELRELSVTILNPRRSEWDASWIESMSNQNFRE